MKASPIRLVALLAKSMFVAGALGLASLLPNNAKAVPTEWSSIADIIAQAPEGFSAEYYASPDGASDAECTAEAPGTIQAAVNKASQGSSWGDGILSLFVASCALAKTWTLGRQANAYSGEQNWMTDENGLLPPRLPIPAARVSYLLCDADSGRQGIGRTREGYALSQSGLGL